MISKIRSLVYKMGFRPKPGTVLFSPSLALQLSFEEAFANWDWSKIQILDSNGELVINMNPCEVCGKTDPEKPTCFRGEKWCCELHRKMIVGELPKR